MNIVRLLALLLIAAGIVGLVYGEFTYTKESHDAKVGPVELSVKDKQTVTVPEWASVSAIVVGVGLVFIPLRPRS
jgi:hypothetical protein